jgi:predicted RNA-binding Zn-ribbon protein involved in translation (DUF1610 family)
MDVHCTHCGFTLDGSPECLRVLALVTDPDSAMFLRHAAQRARTGRIARLGRSIRSLRRLDIPCPSCGTMDCWRSQQVQTVG